MKQSLRQDKPHLDDGVDPLLKKYAPVLYLHPDEEFFPKNIYSMLNESDLMLDKLGFDELIDPMPVALENLSNRAEKYYLDMRNASGGLVNPITNETVDPFLVPDPDRFNNYPQNVYGRTKEVLNFTVLQYWFFYPYNDWILNKHEGDWEMIQIILNKTTKNPLIATYSIHQGGQKHQWSSILKNGTHPKVFVTKGGHGNWATVGNHSFGLSIFGRGICPFDDETSGDGMTLFNTDYNLIQISDNTSWISFNGKWGEVGGLKLAGTFGSNSPKNRQFGEIWNNPIEWGYDPNSFGFVACTGSPVDIHVYDSEGNHVGLNSSNDIEIEINETYFYVPSNNSKEIVSILTPNDLSFVIKANEKGKFNFSIGRNEKDTSIKIIIEYQNINITNQTTATVNMTPANAQFIMEIDEDGDNITDIIKEPDNITILGRENKTINIELKEDWNLISIPFILQNNSIEEVFSSINYSHLFYHNPKWKVPTEINYTMGLWINVNKEDNLTVNGTLPIYPTLNLKQGWNLIGYSSLYGQNVSVVFDSIKNNLLSILAYENDSWKSYNPNKSDYLNTLKKIKPGRGYWVDVNNNVSLVIP